MKDENTFAPLPEHARNMLDAAQAKISKLERLCLDCKHCYIYNAQPRYSELTPGSGIEFRCAEGKWKYDPYNHGKKEMKARIEMARECSDFEEAQT
jgi:hypothetical protein